MPHVAVQFPGDALGSILLHFNCIQMAETQYQWKAKPFLLYGIYLNKGPGRLGRSTRRRRLAVPLQRPTWSHPGRGRWRPAKTEGVPVTLKSRRTHVTPRVTHAFATPPGMTYPPHTLATLLAASLLTARRPLPAMHWSVHGSIPSKPQPPLWSWPIPLPDGTSPVMTPPHAQCDQGPDHASS